MYPLLLISKYLRRKLAPIFAALAVTLCTAMVIIVISVMGGFLEMMRGAAKTLTGEVTVFADIAGFENYEELAADIEALPEVEAVSPIIRSFGLINFGASVQTVEVIGIHPDSFDAVTGYADTLYWTKQHYLDYADGALPSEEGMDEHQRQILAEYRKGFEANDVETFGEKMVVPEHWKKPRAVDAMVGGIEVSPWNQRDSEGNYSIENSQLNNELVLTVMPIARTGMLADITPPSRKFVLVNEFKSGLYEIDDNRVYVGFDALQNMLDMAPKKVWEEFDQMTGEPIGEPTIRSGRASELMIKGVDGVELDTLKRLVDEKTIDFQKRQATMPYLWVQTWEQRHSTLLGAVEKEKGLLTILFGIISLVAIVMIGVIFHMIVMDKTRDIGTLRALGASRWSITCIFLGYGAVVGIIGAGLGSLLAWSIVINLNEIQDLLFVMFEFKMWDPSIYYFERIPSRVDPQEMTYIALFAVASSLFGSIVPAVIAGMLKPVEALRYE